MAFLDTLKQGITGRTPDEQAQIDAAREEAKATSKQLKEQARKKQLNRTIERIKAEPYTAPIKRKAQAEKLKAGIGSLAKKAYTGISGFGAANMPQPAAKQQPQQSYDPFASFGGSFMSSPSPRGQKKAKKPAKAYDPWQNLR
jgi:hypothetical protein